MTASAVSGTGKFPYRFVTFLSPCPCSHASILTVIIIITRLSLCYQVIVPGDLPHGHPLECPIHAHQTPSPPPTPRFICPTTTHQTTLLRVFRHKTTTTKTTTKTFQSVRPSVQPSEHSKSVPALAPVQGLPTLITLGIQLLVLIQLSL